MYTDVRLDELIGFHGCGSRSRSQQAESHCGRLRHVIFFVRRNSWESTVSGLPELWLSDWCCSDVDVLTLCELWLSDWCSGAVVMLSC